MMTHRRAQSNSPVFRRFLSSYLFILFIPLVSGIILSHVAFEIIQEYAQESNLSVLEQSKDILDQRMRELDQMAVQLSANPYVNQLSQIKGPVEGEDTYLIWDARKNLYPFIITNKFINTFYIYFQNSDMIISPYSANLRMSNFYEGILRYDDMDFEQWKGEFLEQYHQRTVLSERSVAINGSSRPRLTYLQNVPYDSVSRSNVLMVFIDTESIINLFNRLNIRQGGWAYIADQEGNILVSYNPEGVDNDSFRLEGTLTNGVFEHDRQDNMLISYTTSSYNNWVYVAALPSDVIYQKANYIRKVTWLLFTITLVLGIIVASFMSAINSKPIRRLFGILRESKMSDWEKGKIAFRDLDGNVSRLIANHKDLQEKIKQQEPLLKAAVIGRLLQREFAGVAEMNTLITQLNIPLPGPYYTVMVVQIHGYRDLLSEEIFRELSISKAVLSDHVEHLFQLNGLKYEMQYDQTAFIIRSDHEHITDLFMDRLAQIEQFMKKNYSIKLSISLGGMHSGIEGISRSFAEAKEALDYKQLIGEQAIFRHDQLPQEKNSPDYPEEVVHQLENMTRLGMQGEVTLVLEDVYRRNFIQRQLSVDRVQQLLYEMRGTIIRLTEYQDGKYEEHIYQLKLQIDQLMSIDMIKDVYDSIKNLYLLLCNDIMAHKERQNIDLQRKMLGFVRKSYPDPDLTIIDLSANLGLSERYVAQFFKEQTGESFPKYLTQLRMDSASRLLKTTDLTIDEIARQVGYYSSHVFRRAFKRSMGISPSVYRELDS